MLSSIEMFKLSIYLTDFLYVSYAFLDIGLCFATASDKQSSAAGTSDNAGQRKEAVRCLAAKVI